MEVTPVETLEGPRLRCGSFYSAACSAMYSIFTCRNGEHSFECWAGVELERSGKQLSLGMIAEVDAAELAMRAPVPTRQDEFDDDNGGMCVCEHEGCDHIGTRGRCEHDGCRCVGFRRVRAVRGLR
jgi:hypothetical protein